MNFLNLLTLIEFNAHMVVAHDVKGQTDQNGDGKVYDLARAKAAEQKHHKNQIIDRQVTYGKKRLHHHQRGKGYNCSNNRYIAKSIGMIDIIDIKGGLPQQKK